MLPPDAPVPSELRHPGFVAVPLTTEVAALDYAAYRASPDVIRVHSDGRWPVDDFSFAHELEQVEQHWADHRAGRSFAFALLDPSRSESLGCLYVNPLRDYLERVRASELVIRTPRGSAMVTFWLRQDREGTGLAEAVVGAVDEWLHADWPLDTYLFRVLPGERDSCAALDGMGLREATLMLPGEARPYRWFESALPRSETSQSAPSH